jgi:hypothetical protein
MGPIKIQSVADNQIEAAVRQSSGHFESPRQVQLDRDHTSSGIEQLSSQDATTGADFNHGSTVWRQELYQRLAEIALSQVMLSESFL